MPAALRVWGRSPRASATTREAGVALEVWPSADGTGVAGAVGAVSRVSSDATDLAGAVALVDRVARAACATMAGVEPELEERMNVPALPPTGRMMGAPTAHVMGAGGTAAAPLITRTAVTSPEIDLELAAMRDARKEPPPAPGGADCVAQVTVAAAPGGARFSTACSHQEHFYVGHSMDVNVPAADARRIARDLRKGRGGCAEGVRAGVGTTGDWRENDARVPPASSQFHPPSRSMGSGRGRPTRLRRATPCPADPSVWSRA